MNPHSLRILAFAFCFKDASSMSLVNRAKITQPSSITYNASLGGTDAFCNSFEGWIGNGIIEDDCQTAINELYRTDVEPRKGQQYEFVRKGAHKTTNLPTVLTPRKHYFGKSIS